MAMGQHYHPPPCHRHHPHNHRWHCCRHHRQHMIIDQHQNCSRERCHFGQDLEFIDQSFLPVFSVLAMLTFFSTWLSGKLYQYCPTINSEHRPILPPNYTQTDQRSERYL